MELPFDVVDYIFGFLKSDPESLVACSKAHPVFSQIVEKYLYYHIVIHTRTDPHWSLQPLHFIKLLSDTPQIVNHVRILQIVLHSPTIHNLEAIQALSMFPLLECIVLSGNLLHPFSWNELPQCFRTAVEDCLCLPTLREVHVRNVLFPLSLLNNLVNVDCFSLSGSPQIHDCQADTYPQLQSLSVHTIDNHNLASFITWAKRRILKLQSLECDYYSDEQIIFDLLEICSDTLNNLDLSFEHRYLQELYIVTRQSPQDLDETRMPSINLSSLPHLQHLTVRVHVSQFHGRFCSYNCINSLFAAGKILKTVSSLRHLTIGIFVHEDLRLSDIDFSPLTALAESSHHRIDLYIIMFTKDILHSEVVSSLARYAGLMELIEKCVLTIHVGETAPGISPFV